MSLINIFCKTKMYRKNIALLEISSTHITLFSLRGMKISPDQGELNFCSNLEKVHKRLKYQGFMKHLFSKSFLLKNLKDSKVILFSYRNCLTEEQYHGYAPVSLESIGERKISKQEYSVDSIKRTVHLTFHGLFFLDISKNLY